MNNLYKEILSIYEINWVSSVRMVIAEIISFIIAVYMIQKAIKESYNIDVILKVIESINTEIDWQIRKVWAKQMKIVCQELQTKNDKAFFSKIVCITRFITYFWMRNQKFI